ncbi:MAG: hypothetical protein JWN34_3628, partial [Bryobacterales bacterium]|nr:hypothetical protein [Bryobacterales bacterium]
MIDCFGQNNSVNSGTHPSQHIVYRRIGITGPYAGGRRKYAEISASQVSSLPLSLSAMRSCLRLGKTRVGSMASQNSVLRTPARPTSDKLCEDMSSLLPVAAAIRRLLDTPAGGLWLILSLTCPGGLLAANHEALKADAGQYFRDRVTPFVKTYCLSCHRSERPTRAGVNFTPALKTPEHAAFTEYWKKADARVRAHDMPPKGAPQPSDDDRRMFAEWLPKLKYLSDKDPGPFVIRRLTKPEYANTLHDLFGVPASIADGLPDEVAGQGYLNSLSPLQLEQYLAIAENVLRQIVAPPGHRRTEIEKRLLGSAARPGARPAGDPRKAARQVAQSLARKAYRRPPTEAELDTLVSTFDLGTRNKLAYQQALGLMLKGILVSPQFLFITPAADAGSGAAQPSAAGSGGGIVPLDDYQLASRLSYFLWATMPDEELMTLADRGKLHEPVVLQAQTKRLLDDSRSRALFDGFGAQWLNVGGLQRQVFDPALFPQMTPVMRQSMYDEVRLFFQGIVRDNEPAIRFVDSDYTYLNGTVAAIYGLESAVQGPEMRKVRLSDRDRGGVLAMPGILAASSLPNRTSPVKRGVWVLEQVLGEHVPAPPPDVPALDKQDPAAVARLTLRQRTELHR